MFEKINHNDERKPVREEGLEKIREILNQAKNEKKIVWEETGDEFIIKFGQLERQGSEPNPKFEREIHIPKWEKIPLPGNAKPIEKIIEALLENPEAGGRNKIAEIIRSIEETEKTDSIE